jgi:tRNA-specific 2-thiouridylase
LRSADEFKDQTYFIYNITPAQLPHVLFPIGGMKKPEVKKLAARIGLPNAARKESMGLCFVGKVRLKDFLEQKIKAKPGKIMLGLMAKGIGLSKNSKNKNLALSPVTYTLIGQHTGLHNYTIGQRQGINVGGPGGPYFVLRKDLKKNILYVTNNPKDPGLEVTEVQLHSVNWITELGLRAKGIGLRKNQRADNLALSTITYTLTCRYRHQGELVPCTVEQTGKDLYSVKFKTPQKALASGQSIVFYKEKVCLGGGVIV